MTYLHTTDTRPALLGSTRAAQVLTLLLVSRDPAVLQRLKEFLELQAPELQIQTRLITNGHLDPLHDLPTLPDLLLLHLSDQWQGELSALEERPSHLRPPFLAIASHQEHGAMRQAMRAGARDFLVDPIQEQELVDVITRLTQEEQQNRRREKGLLTACINAKGGSGATMLACNLAHIIRQVKQQEVILMDLDIQFGALAHYLDLEPTNGVLEALGEVEELDATALSAYLLRHKSGLRVMGTTRNQIQLPLELSGERMARLLELVQRNCHQLVVDLPRVIDMTTAAVIEHADKIVLVVQQDLINMQDASRLIDILRHEFGILDDQILVAVNRFSRHAQVTEEDIRKTLKTTNILAIPNDYKHVLESQNSGVPLYSLARRAAITRALVRLEQQLHCPAPSANRGLFSKMIAKLTGG